MPVEQHLHRFFLEFFGVDVQLRLGVLVDLHSSLLGCWIGVKLRRRSGHRPYTSAFSYSLPGTKMGEDVLEARSGSIPGIWGPQVPGTPWQLRGCRPCLQRDGLRLMALPELTG